MSVFGFIFWRLLLLPINAPIWFIVGFVVSYFKSAFSGFWLFLFYIGCAVFLVPIGLHLLRTILAFLGNYFDMDMTLGDMIDDLTPVKHVPRPAVAPGPAPTPAARSQLPRNNCVYCVHERGVMPNRETGHWCTFFNEAVIQTSRGYDIYNRSGLNDYPEHSGRAQDNQMSCAGFQLDPGQRERWNKLFG